MDPREKFRSFRSREAGMDRPPVPAKSAVARLRQSRHGLPPRSATIENLEVIGGPRAVKLASIPPILPPRSATIENLEVIGRPRVVKLASIPPALPPRSATIKNLEVIDGRVAVIGAPDTARRARWILGRNFGASAAAKRRGPGGEIYSRGPSEEIYSRGSACVNLSVILHKNRKGRGENLCKSIDNSRGFAKMESGSREYFTRRIPDEHRLTHCEESERRLRDHEGGDKSQTGCQKMPTGSERQGT